MKFYYQKLWNEYGTYRSWLTKFNDNAIIKWNAEQLGDSTSVRVVSERSPAKHAQAVQSALLKRRHELLALLVSNLANKVKRADVIACMDNVIVMETKQAHATTVKLQVDNLLNGLVTEAIGDTHLLRQGVISNNWQ